MLGGQLALQELALVVVLLAALWPQDRLGCWPLLATTVGGECFDELRAFSVVVCVGVCCLWRFPFGLGKDSALLDIPVRPRASDRSGQPGNQG